LPLYTIAKRAGEVHHSLMKQRLMKSLKVSIEWRVIAFIITNLFLWATTGSLWQATLLALSLQGILFVTHFIWYFVRETEWHPVKDA
jgi:hypothetical protein